MSSVKIQVLVTGIEPYITQVLVDNKPAYVTRTGYKAEKEHIKKLIELLELDNVETSDKFRV